MKKYHFLRLLPLIAAIGMLAVISFSSMAADDRWETATSKDDEDNIVVTFPDLKVVLPAEWSGKVQMEYSDSGPCFYHIDSREKWTEKLGFETGGFLFGITFDEEGNTSYEDATVIGSTEEGTYLAYFPSDVQAYTDDAVIQEDYASLWDDIEWVKEHMTMSAGGSSEYILPNSSSEYLTQSDLEGMDEYALQMAINEIYARHGRKFKTQSIQDYFDSMSWYTPTVEADAFDDSVFNEYEHANVDLMVNQMNAVS